MAIYHYSTTAAWAVTKGREMPLLSVADVLLLGFVAWVLFAVWTQ